MKFLGIMIVVGALVLADARSANAQLILRAPVPGYNPSIYRFMYGGMTFPSPTGGYGFAVQRQYFFTTNLRPFHLPVYIDPKIAYGYAYGTHAGSMMGGVNALAVREQFAIQQAQRVARLDAGARMQVFDQWSADRGSRPIDAERLKNLTPAVRDAIVAPSDGDVASGKTLNELVQAIHHMKLGGAKAETPFLPPEVLDRITFAGGPAADALNLLRSGELEFPAALRATEYDSLRRAIEKDVASAQNQVHSGKRVDFYLIEQIEANVRKLKAKAEPVINTDAAAAAFLERMEGIAKYLKSPEGSALIVPTWQTVGVSLEDLTQFMNRHQIRFGPSRTGNEAAYAALHRGMVGYHNQLLQVSR
jgi:hypothetical protein